MHYEVIANDTVRRETLAVGKSLLLLYIIKYIST